LQVACAFHAELGGELSRLVPPLADQDREHLRSAMAEIIASYRAPGPDHC
jgi:hypothetical protein